MSAATAPTPDHIPRELVRDIDIYDLPGAGQDIHLAWYRLREQGPLFWTPRNGGHWFPTRGALIKALFLDTGNFSSLQVAIPRSQVAVPLLPIEADAPDHMAYRAIIQPAFVPKAVEAYAHYARQLAGELIEDFYARGQCEFIAEFGLVLPLVVFLHIVDLPVEDREMLHGISETMARDPDVEKRSAAYMALLDYIRRRAAERRANPGDDLLSRIVLGQVHGRPLSEKEMLGLAATTLLGGLDTVASLLGFSTLFLARNPAHVRQLVDEPDLIANAAEELLRRFAPSTVGRIAARGVVFQGVEIRKDEQILLPALMHGLDDDEFPDPLRVDFHRAAATHGSFGFGPHRCPGSFLARTELKIFLEEWLKRIPEFRVADESGVVTNCGEVNNLLRLPLAWNVKH